jgi:hypothetical protein
VEFTVIYFDLIYFILFSLLKSLFYGIAKLLPIIHALFLNSFFRFLSYGPSADSILDYFWYYFRYVKLFFPNPTFLVQKLS